MTTSSEYHLKLRSLTAQDYATLCQLLSQDGARGAERWSRRAFNLLVRDFPEGQLGIEDNGVLVAVLLSVRLDYTRFSDPDHFQDLLLGGRSSQYDDQGDSLYALELFVAPEHRDLRLGHRLLEAVKELCRRENLKAVLAACPLRNYAAMQDSLGVSEYIDQVERREIYDASLSFLLNNKFDIKRVLGGRGKGDECAALLEWDNIFYEPREPGLARPTKTNVRVGVVQWQMRKTASMEEMLAQIEFFVQSMSNYKSDFALFPEFFTAPLMGLTSQTRSVEAIRTLASYTPRMLDAISHLAVSYNINIIAGSMPVLEDDGELYNVAYLCKRDGTVESQYKIHPTPGEKFEWAMAGGDRLKVFDTDCGKIGILICYDVEFPELARLLCLQGMQILFVPFWTDTKNGFLRVQRCAQARAIENECYVALAGSCGNLPEVNNVDIQYAQSAVYSPSDFAFPHDAIVSETTPNTEMELIVDLDLEKLKRLRNEGAVTNFKDRREDLYELRWKGRT